jgi:glycosyltransferase involved in cell wall biosynthesis
MKRLKICMVTTFYPPYNFGGDGVFVQRLANALSRQGHEVHVVHDRDAFQFGAKGLPDADLISSSGRSESSIQVHTLSSSDGGTADLILRHQLGRPVGKSQQLKELLEGQQFDVIHFHNISLMGGPQILKYGKNAVKLCTLHDHWFVCSMHVLWRYDKEACTKRTCLSCTLSSKRPPQFWRYTGAIKSAARHVHAFLSPSEFARQSHLTNGFPAAIRVLPHFLPEQEFAAPVSGEQALSIAHPRPYFLFVGRLEKLKGVQVLIDEFRNYQRADLLIAGTGIYEAELKEMAKGLPHVHFIGRVPHQVLKNLYSQAIAVMVPSLCYETFGLVALEAFAVSTPVIVNNLGALPELVESSGGGFTVDFGGKPGQKRAANLTSVMESLRLDLELRHKMGRAGFENYRKNYTEEIHLRRYYDLIEELNRKIKMQEVS